MTKEQIIEQINKSFSEHKGTNEAIDDAAFYIEAAIKQMSINFSDWRNKLNNNEDLHYYILNDGSGRMVMQFYTLEQLYDQYLEKNYKSIINLNK